MAKRKRKAAHHRTHRRRRHHSGIHGISMNTLTPTLIQVGEGVAGAILASFADKKFLVNFQPDKPAMGKMLLLGAGVGAALLIKNPHVKAVAMGVASYGGLQLAIQTIPGIQDLVIGDLDGMMENLMIGATTESMMISSPGNEYIQEAVVIEDDVVFK